MVRIEVHPLHVRHRHLALSGRGDERLEIVLALPEPLRSPRLASALLGSGMHGCTQQQCDLELSGSALFGRNSRLTIFSYNFI
jgi:hypothetical protein